MVEESCNILPVYTIAINVHIIKIITHNFNHPPYVLFPSPNTLAQEPMPWGSYLQFW